MSSITNTNKEQTIVNSSTKHRLRRLDARADRLAHRSAKLVIGLVAALLLAIVVVPVLLKGPGGLIEAIANFGFALNESGAESYAPMQEIGIGEVPEGCGTSFDVPGSGTINVTPKEGC